MKQVRIIQRGYLFCSVSCACDLCRHADATFETLEYPPTVRFMRDAPKSGPSEFLR